MYNWFDSLPAQDNTNKSDFIKQFRSPNLFAGSGMVVKTSDKESMEKKLISGFIKHFNLYARQFVHAEKSIVVVIDGFSSRKGVYWIEEGRKYNAITVVNASDTSQLSKPCDLIVNRTLKKYIKDIRE